MPSLLRLAGEAVPSRVAVAELSDSVATALESAEAAGYRVDAMLGAGAAKVETKIVEKLKKPAPQAKPRRKRALKRKK